MNEKNQTRDWIANSLIMTYLEDTYKKISDAVADYGYINREVTTGARASQMVEYMFVVPRTGAGDKFAAIAADLGVEIAPEILKIDGVPRNGFLMRRGGNRNLIMVEMVRQVVKSERARAAMIQHAAQMQKAK